MQIARRRQSEQPLQQDLARRGIEQIRAAHHVGDALIGIIDHHRKLVGVEAVGAEQDEIADFLIHGLRDIPLEPVGECDGFTPCSQAHRTRSFSRGQALAAGARIDAGAIRHRVRRVLAFVAHCRVRDLLSAAATPINLSGLPEPLECGAVGIQSRALVDHGTVPLQSQRFQLAQDDVRRFRARARAIQVLHAHAPRSLRSAGVEPARHCGDQGTEMQRPRRRRGKTSNGHARPRVHCALSEEETPWRLSS